MNEVKKKGETKKKRGRPSTGGRDPTFTLRMPPEHRQEAERIAEQEGITLAKAILRVFEEGLAARRKGKGKGQ